MDYIATDTKEASVCCNGSMKMWTFGEGLVDRRKPGKASIVKPVAVCRKIRPLPPVGLDRNVVSGFANIAIPILSSTMGPNTSLELMAPWKRSR